MTLKGGFTGKLTEFFLDFFFQLWSPPKSHKFFSPQKNQFFSELEKQKSFLGTQKFGILGGGSI